MKRASILAFALATTVAKLAAAVVEDALPPSIVHEPCEQYMRGQAFEIRARFLDDSAIFDPKVIYRSGSDFWKNAPFQREANSDDFMAVIRVRDLKGPLEYFIEAFDENGNGPARYGSPEAPVRLLPSSNPEECRQISDVQAPVAVQAASPRAGAAEGGAVGGAVAAPAPGALDLAPPPPAAPRGFCRGASRPFYCSPWVWGAAGAVVLGGIGTATYLLLRDEPAGAGGDVSISVGVPDPTTADLGAGGR